jgi:hypothetical protein
MQNQTPNNQKAAVCQTSDRTREVDKYIEIRTVPEDLIYFDMREMEGADYKQVAELDLDDFHLAFVNDVDSDVRNWISGHAAEVKAKCGETFEFDTVRAVIVAGMLGERAYRRGVDREEFDYAAYPLSTEYNVKEVAEAWLAGWDRTAAVNRAQPGPAE